MEKVKATCLLRSKQSSTITLNYIYWKCLKKALSQGTIKGTLMLVWKSANILVFIQKRHVEEFTLKHLLLSEICAREICEYFVSKHSETIVYGEN